MEVICCRTKYEIVARKHSNMKRTIPRRCPRELPLCLGVVIFVVPSSFVVFLPSSASSVFTLDFERRLSLVASLSDPILLLLKVDR